MLNGILKGFAGVVVGVAALALSEEHPAGGVDAGKKKAEVVKEGVLVCVGCHLEKEHGASAQCTLHAKHAQGLLAPDGSLWTLLDTARGHTLVTDRKLLGKPIRLHGWGFPKAQVLEAHRYDLKEGEAWVAYDYCKECGGFEKGDNQGKDLCAGCQTGEGCK